MTDADYLSPQQNQCILTMHSEVLSRADRGTGVVNGNRLSASDPASMVVPISAGRIRIAGAPQDVSGDTTVHDVGHATLSRIDIIYRDEAGDAKIAKGTAAAIEDPKGLSAWRSYTSPAPPGGIPPGAIIGAVWVPAQCQAITSSYIWMFAGGVGDIATTIDMPGVDSRPSSEKAGRTELDARILHTLAQAAIRNAWEACGLAGTPDGNGVYGVLVKTINATGVEVVHEWANYLRANRVTVPPGAKPSEWFKAQFMANIPVKVQFTWRKPRQGTGKYSPPPVGVDWSKEKHEL